MILLLSKCVASMRDLGQNTTGNCSGNTCEGKLQVLCEQCVWPEYRHEGRSNSICWALKAVRLKQGFRLKHGLLMKLAMAIC